MNDVEMYPNPRFGQPGRSGHIQKSEFLADVVVAELSGVKAAVRAEGKQIGARAAAHLHIHKANNAATGNIGPGSHIKVSQGLIDAHIELVDRDYPPNALAIEGETNALAAGLGKRRLVKRPSHDKRKGDLVDGDTK